MVKINPFDIIRTTEELPAFLIIHGSTQQTERSEVVLPAETVLLSNVCNYHLSQEFSFAPQNKRQFETIRNLFPQKGGCLENIVGYTYTINAADLQNCFTTIQHFNYKYLNPKKTPHIYLIALLYLENKTIEVPSSRYLCFVADACELEITKANFENGLLTKKEATDILASQIKEQMDIRKQ